MTKLRDYEVCPNCRKKGRVIDSKKRRAGYRRRLHRCGACRISWPSYQSTIDPRRVVTSTQDAPRPSMRGRQVAAA